MNWTRWEWAGPQHPFLLSDGRCSVTVCLMHLALLPPHHDTQHPQTVSQRSLPSLSCFVRFLSRHWHSNCTPTPRTVNRVRINIPLSRNPMMFLIQSSSDILWAIYWSTAELGRLWLSQTQALNFFQLRGLCSNQKMKNHGSQKPHSHSF